MNLLCWWIESYTKRNVLRVVQEFYYYQKRIHHVNQKTTDQTI
jgi:hypothetical protein